MSIKLMAAAVALLACMTAAEAGQRLVLTDADLDRATAGAAAATPGYIIAYPIAPGMPPFPTGGGIWGVTIPLRPPHAIVPLPVMMPY